MDDQRITIREGMSEIQTVSAVIHEIAHSKLHNTKNKDEQKDRRTAEVEAESISYAVCAYYGICTDENSFGYIAGWSKDKALPELHESLEIINKTSAELIDDIDQRYEEIKRDNKICSHIEKSEKRPSMLAKLQNYQVEKKSTVRKQPKKEGVEL